jgi:hypothetical protein
MQFRGLCGLVFLAVLGACSPAATVDGTGGAAFVASPASEVSRESLEQVLLRSVMLSL